MNHDIFETIEFTKILAYLAKNTHSSLTQERILNTRPETDIHIIEKKLTEITEFRAILDFDDAFPFSSFENVIPLLTKVEVPGNYLEAPLFLKLWK
ncbi:hypothetical protein KAH55_04915, partial [bacterium]|nr:hypothetical protein [bacterium]